MKKLNFLFCLIVFLTACPEGSPEQQGNSEQRLSYLCDNDVIIQVLYKEAGDWAVLFRNGVATDLKRAVSKQDFFYTSGPLGIRGDRKKLSLLIGRMAPIACRVTGK